jgi:DNA-binding CsgD family transcriptional regulator
LIKLLERRAEMAAIGAVLRSGGLVVVEGGAGIGKSALLEAAFAMAAQKRRLVLRARGTDLERDFAFGVVRQLFERYCSTASSYARAALFANSARAVRGLLLPGPPRHSEGDSSSTTFAVLHGLYWLTINLASRRPLLIAVDDTHWADEASARWLAHLGPRLAGPSVALIVTLRPDEPRSQTQALLAVRAAATATIRPALLSERGVAALARRMVGNATSDEICAAIHNATGGNPFYVLELLRALKHSDQPSGGCFIEDVMNRGGIDGIALQLAARLRNLDPRSLSLAQAIAILGDGCELRHAATVSGIAIGRARNLAAGLVRLDVLGDDRPPRFIHPIVRHAVARTLSRPEQEAGHRAAARMLHAEHVPCGRIAAHLMGLSAGGDVWIVQRLREAAQAALENGAPAAAAELLERALLEPPPSHLRVEVLRESARAQQQAGKLAACRRLEEAMAIARDLVLRAELASELARIHAELFRWTESVHVLENALATLRNAPEAVRTRLQSQLLVAALQDARTAPRAAKLMEQLSRRRLPRAPAVALAVAQGMVGVMTGRPAEQAALPLQRALASNGARVEDWDTQAALWWCLLIAERFSTVETALRSLTKQVDHSGNSRALVAVYSTLGFLKFRLGALPEADAAARIALRVAQEGDFAPGLPFAATVLADVAAASGELAEAKALLDSIPFSGFSAGVGTVLVPAARGRLFLAEGRAREALAEFEACMALWRSDAWGMEMRDVGYLHSRSGAAQALLALGDLRRARELADAELADVRRFGGTRALGVALRVAGLVRGGNKGLAALEESVDLLNKSPAVLEHAQSLVHWGAALRRASRRQEARQALSQGLGLAARCGARPLIALAREELRVAGARPRRDWTRGIEALTASEVRIVRLAHAGRTNRQIAQELYLSIKTVEGHLGRAYDKLDIASRRELDRVLEPEKSRVPTL